MNEPGYQENQQSDMHYDLIERARERIIESLAQNMDLYGVTLSIGHLYGTLLFQNKPMSLDEMVEALGMSKTSMSTGVRVLQDLKMVNKVWMKGSRKDQYEVEPDWYQNFIDFFSLKWGKATDDNLHAFRRSIQELKELQKEIDLPETTRQTIEQDLQKLQSAVQYYEWILRLIESFESHEIFNFIPKEK